MNTKKLFFFAIAALGLAACSNDEVVDTIATSETNEINFRPLITNATRTANSPGVKESFETDDVINVYALYKSAKYFQDDFTKQAGETGFTSAKPQYWPSDVTTNSVTFTAIWGATQTVGTAGNFTGYTPAAAAGSQKDILVAKHTSATKENPVLLNFRHTLSQIVVKAQNTNPNLKVTISGVRIGYIKTASTNFTYSGGVTDTRELGTTDNAFNVVQGDWSLVDFAGELASGHTYADDYKYTQDLTASPTELTSTQAATTINGFTSWILLPQNMKASTDTDADGIVDYANAKDGGVATDAPDLGGSYIALEMQIENYDVATTTAAGVVIGKQWCYWPITTNWNPGYKYTYTIDVAGGGYMPTDTNNDKELDPVFQGAVIVFSAACTIDEWDPQAVAIEN